MTHLSVVQMQITWKDREGNGKVEQNQIMMSFRCNAIFNEDPLSFWRRVIYSGKTISEGSGTIKRHSGENLETFLMS